MDPTEQLMQQYSNRPDLAKEFAVLVLDTLVQNQVVSPPNLEAAVEAVAEQRPDLFMAYVAGRKKK